MKTKELIDYNITVDKQLIGFLSIPPMSQESRDEIRGAIAKGLKCPRHYIRFKNVGTHEIDLDSIEGDEK